MKTNCDAIIATRNRLKSCLELVNELLAFDIFDTIIVVDSSDSDYSDQFKKGHVEYLKTKITNQPFQRFLGYKFSDAEILYFFDDDVKITDSLGLEAVQKLFDEGHIVGASLNIHLDRENPEKSAEKIRHNILLSFIKKFKPGEYWISGLKQSYPKEGGNVEYLKGPAFTVRRKYLYKNFDFRLFDIYSLGLGKGEDAILSYTLSKQGIIKYIPISSIHHQVVSQSAYANTPKSYFKRYAYSRYYHTLNYCRLNNFGFVKKISSLFVYYLIIGSTLLKSVTKALLMFSKMDFERAKGIFSGMLKTSYVLSSIGTEQEVYLKWNQLAEDILKVKKNNTLK